MSSPPPKPSAIAEHDAALGPDRALALLHLPADSRPAVEALWLLDATLGDVVARATQPTLGRIKLAWWREALERLDRQPPPPEPRLRAAADHLLPRGVTGAELAGLETGWSALLDDPVDPALVAERGALLFAIAGRVLGGGDERLAPVGAVTALASVARRGLPDLLAAAEPYALGLRGHRFPRRLRGLTMLARVAMRDLAGPPFEPEGSRGRILAMLAHRWSGRV